MAVGSLLAVTASGVLAPVAQGVPGTTTARAATPVSLAAAGTASRSTTISSTGLKTGQVKHVWLIILENKSYDATFTGLNKNSYLWKALPKQGALLTHYYGTGHSSMDNYLSLVSGQAPEEDTQSDCSVVNTNFSSNADIVTSGGSLRRNADYGQAASSANSSQPSGANAPNGTNGCTYPRDVPTLFNQLDAAGRTWKGYAQDLHDQANREDAACGGPGTAANNPDTNPTYLTATSSHPYPSGVTTFTGAQPDDQYVAKHFPFPWFHSLIGDTTDSGATTTAGLTRPAQGGSDCDSQHIANLDDASHGLAHDLRKESTTPAFSWITPNNCSDAHDAVCKGNNLSGSFTASGQPVYQAGTPDPESTTPRNSTGGLYASDLFLKYYLPLIEHSAAFRDGGLIDVTFDEGTPPFTYSGNSFNNANAYGPTRHDQPDAKTGIATDAAGETISGHTVHSEPTGPNSTLGVDSAGDQLYPGPGNNSFIDRPPACTQTSPRVPADCVPGIVRAGSGTSPGARTDTATAGTGSTTVQDPLILADDTGREVTDTVDTSGTGGTSPIPADSFVGAVTNTGPLFPVTSTDPVTTGSFQLVDQSGTPVTPTGSVTHLTLSAEGDPGHLTAGQTADPLWDATDATPGGGNTGSVLISPLIKPGTVSGRYYNHYSWLRTMEDIFGVSGGRDHSALPAGTVSGGLDGLGHLGYAAQAGLAPFGPDVFTAAHPTRHHRKGHHQGTQHRRAATRAQRAASAVDSTESGSVQQPALTSEGEAVRAHLPGGGAVTVRVSGPETPGEGLPFQAAADTATWQVTLSHATRSLPLSVGAFSAVDARGAVYSPAVVPGSRELPSRLRPGQRVSVALRAVLPVGEGVMRWAPLRNDVLGSWDFVVEND